MVAYGIYRTFSKMKATKSAISIFFICLFMCCYGPQEIHLAAGTNPQLNSALFVAAAAR